ncbi:MAG TPA: hemerythrin domain-containing protein [Candidatus Aquicultoraceae bacterium]|nr:hemerythrin domain-containing protein [Candidatus Aquicultoraceae bacterium]
MKSTEVLKEEHGGVKTMLAILGKVSDRLGSAKAVPADDLDRILEFLQVFVDRCHHAKEEDFLFPALERTGMPREGGPIGELLSEHVQGRELIRGMREAADGCRRGDRDAAERFAFHARGYAELLLAHIEKEDEILYPLADRQLDVATDRTLVEEFERVEEERVGHGKHEEFHRLLEDLQKFYGS